MIWKANRAKSKIARRLIAKDPHQRTDLEAIVRSLTEQIFKAPDDAARLKLMREAWGFRLPMASAVLTVFYPETFTVYDVRVCEQIGGHRHLDHRRFFTSFWKGYQSYVAAVRSHAPDGLTLRDMDRYLWGKSFAEGLRQGIISGFPKPPAAGLEDDE